MKFILIFTLFSSLSFAKTVARVSSIEGNAFYYGPGESVQTIGYSDKVVAGSKVMLEDDSKLVLTTEDGTKYYITSGSFVKFYEDGIELKNGKVWIKAVNGSKHSIVQTANSKGIHSKGQYVYSFDNVTGKSQVLNIFGEVSFSNLSEQSLKTKVSAGEFSFVSLKENDGFPRVATRVGAQSYESVKVSFKHFSDLRKVNFENISKSEPIKRSIASVNTLKPKGSIKFVKYSYKKKAKRKIASISPKVKSKTKKVAKVRVFKSKPFIIKKAPVKKFVQTKVIPDLNIKPVVIKRKPASVNRDISTVSVFEKSLRKNIEVKPRHKTEVNELIDDLKSYKEDFVKEY